MACGVIFCSLQSCLCFLRHSGKFALTGTSFGMLECVSRLNGFSLSYIFRDEGMFYFQKSNIFSIHLLVKHLQTWVLHISKHSRCCSKLKSLSVYLFHLQAKKEAESLPWCEINFLLYIEACFFCTKITSSLLPLTVCVLNALHASAWRSGFSASGWF